MYYKIQIGFIVVFTLQIAEMIMGIIKNWKSNTCLVFRMMIMHQDPDGRDRTGAWYYIFAVLTVFFVYGYMFYMYA